MATLTSLGLLFLFVSLAKSDVSLEKWESKDFLRTKLEDKLSSMKSSENEVADVKPQPKPDLLKAEKKPEYPVAFVGGEPPCPNFNDVMEDVKTSMKHLNEMVNAFISIFSDTFNNPNYKCPLSLNPLKTLKCFVRVFAVSYKDLTAVWTEASALRKDLSKLLAEYGQYSTKCNKNWTFGNTLQLVNLFKFVEGYIKDA